MTRLVRTLLALSALLSACAPPASRPADAPSAPALVLSTYAYGGNDRLEHLRPLAAHLSARLGRPVVVRGFADPLALVEALRRGEADLALVNTLGWLLVAADAEPRVEPLVTLHTGRGVPTPYRSVIVAPRDVTSGSLAARAASLRIAFVSAGSTTGGLVPRLALAGMGIADADRAFASLRYAGTHAAAARLLAAGDVDVAALAAEEWERSVTEDGALGRRFHVVWASPQIPLGPLVARRALRESLRDSVLASLLALPAAHPEAFAALRATWVEARSADTLVRVTDRDYDEFRRALGGRAVVERSLRASR